MSRTSVGCGFGFLLALCACKDKLPWNPKALTRIAEGPFSFAVPDGWRDTSESKVPALAHIARRAGATAHILVRENDSDTDSNVAFQWTDTLSTATCETLMLSIDQQMGGTVDRSTLRSENMRGDTACVFESTDEDTHVTTWLRVHGNNMVTIACLRPNKGDSNLDQWCQHFVAELRAQ